jgi:metal-responsive CopG/Arc/MetJ family transcriptional regulator
MSKSIKLSQDLWDRIRKCAEKAGYSSAEEFIQHVLEKEVARAEDAETSDEVERRLRGLGYLE